MANYSRVYVEHRNRLSRIPSLTSLLVALAEHHKTELVILDIEDKVEDSVALSIQELLDFSVIINARMQGQKSALVTRGYLSQVGMERLRQLHEAGKNVTAIVRTLREEGYTLRTKSGKTKQIEYTTICRLISQMNKTNTVSNPVKEFCQRHLVESDGNELEAGAAYARYVRLCTQRQVSHVNPTTFGKFIFKLFPKVKRVRHKEYWYSGLALKV